MRSKTNLTNDEESGKWRSYQSRLQQKAGIHQTYRRIPGYALLLAVLILINNGVFRLLDTPPISQDAQSASLFTKPMKTVDKAVLKQFFNQIHCTNQTQNEYRLSVGQTTYQIATSLDVSLQDLILKNIDRKNSRYFGFIAMDPDTGRILSMVSYDQYGEVADICALPDFPAASLIKIVTAAAAIETCGYSGTTLVTYNGNKYSLYKSQLKDIHNRYTHQMPFREAFADSVNPVFGKIGARYLGPSIMASYAEAFGFNRQFDLEIPMKPSQIHINEDPYNWAEVACGFNRSTLISPLHAALMIAAITHNGQLLEPTVIDRISVDDQTIYQRSPRAMAQVIRSDTASALQAMMTETISSGTAAKSFRGAKKDKILSRLSIGGKTGSINGNGDAHIKYDWFAGFAAETQGSKKVVVSALVVHKNFIGLRSAQYARMAMKEYFRQYYASSNS